MKGYRTPSWFRMKGFAGKKKAKAQKGEPGRVRPGRRAGGK